MDHGAQASRIGIIGGGLGGLSAACTLAARGHAVVLFEHNDWLGGKAAVLQRDGFRFDMGPTILMLPSVLRRIFAEAGRSLDEALDLIRLDPQWRCFFDDGSQLDLVSQTDEMEMRLERFTQGTAASAGYRKFLGVARRMHDVSERFFFWKSVGSVRDTLTPRQMLSWKVLRDVANLRFGRSVAGLVRSNIPDARVAQMVDHFTQYVGSAPEASPAVLCGIAHMQTSEGIWYPRGGTRAIPESLVRLATELGVEFRMGVQVTRIVTDHDAVQAVELNSGECVPVRAVISNCDSVRTHRELLTGRAAARFARRRRYEPACSGVVLYLGLKRRYEQLLHHNFLFSHDPHAEFHAIYRQAIPAPDPTCYVCAPAISEPGVAPAGGEALYILVHTPYLRPHHDWGQMWPGYRETILDKLERTAGLTDLRAQIVCEERLTPDDIHRRYHVLNGAIYGLASHGLFQGGFKPANRSPDVRGLYLAGGAAHPGPGMPMVLMSGWIAADALHADFAPLSAVGAPSTMA
ncbi:MAG: phytoene desaturase family protein [Planctomycetales bacterium]